MCTHLQFPGSILMATLRAGSPDWLSANLRSIGLYCAKDLLSLGTPPSHGPPSTGAQWVLRAQAVSCGETPNPTQGCSLRIFLPPFSAQVTVSVASSCKHPAESSVVMKQRILTQFLRLTGGGGKGVSVLIPPTRVGVGEGQTDGMYMLVNHLSYCRFP